MKNTFIILIICFISTYAIGQTTYYVSSSMGSDSYNGQSSAVSGTNGPWRTLAAISNRSFRPGDIILLRRGDTWSETLTVSTSGITIGAYGSGSDPVINGANVITGWSLYNSSRNIWVASVSATGNVNQVFVDGERQTIARWPNSGWQKISVTSSGNTSLQSTVLNQSTDYWKGCNVIYRYNWAFSEANITASSPGNNSISFTGAPSGYIPQKDWGFYIEGKLEELDIPGEYFFNVSNRLLYVALPVGKSPSNSKIEASVREYGISATSKNNVTIQNLRIINAGNTGIYFFNSSNNQVLNCKVEYSKRNGIDIRRTSGTMSNITIDGCNISEVDGGGPRFAAGIMVEGFISNVVISNNNLEDISSDLVSPRWGSGIYIGAGVSNSTILNNSITRTSKNGIHLSSQSGPTRIAYNTLHNCITLLDDAGGIYMNGNQTGTIVEYNILSDFPGSKQGAPDNYNPFTIGLYSDASGNYGAIFRGNVVSGCTHGALLHLSYNTTLVNNTFYNNRGTSIYLSERSQNQVVNNVIKNNICYGVGSSQYTLSIIRHPSSTLPVGQINNNLYYNPNNSTHFRFGNTGSPLNVLTYAQWRSKTGIDSGHDSNSLSTNPLLVNVAANNFQLTSSSPCIDAGTNVDLAKDIIGTVIPRGNAPDIGAYEYFSATNSAPIARAGNAQTVNEGNLVTLDGSGSYDPDGDPITYRWTPPSGISLSSTTTSKPTFTAPQVNNDTQFTFTLVVNDGKVNSAASQVIITVKNVITNTAPVARAGNAQTVNEGALVTLDGSSSSDPDGDPITYQWTAPTGITLNSTTAVKPTFTAPQVNSDSQFTFTLVVNDGKVNSTASQVIITVKNVITNTAPVARAGNAQTVNEGTLVTLDGSGSSDPDGDPITYNWTAPTGITLSSTTAMKPTFIAPEVNQDTQYNFSLVVNDGKANSSVSQVVVTVKNVIGNKAPVANAGANITMRSRGQVTLDASGSYDPDGDPLTYRWTVSNQVLSGVRIIYTAPYVEYTTNYTVTLVVNDGKTDSAPSEIVITVRPSINTAPIADAGSNQSVSSGSLVTLNGSSSYDPNNDPITYQWTAPSGITLSSTSVATPTFIAPQVSQTTQYTFSLVVNDGTVNSTAKQVVITVNNNNKPPVANAGTNITLNSRGQVALDGSGSYDPDGDPLTYRWTVSNQVLTGVRPLYTAPYVEVTTNYTVTLIVNDGKTDSAPSEIVITVRPSINSAPVADAGSNQTVPAGTLVTLNGSSSYDPDNDPITYQWTAPSGITLSSTAVAMPTFIAPQVSQTTQYTFSLVVNDGSVNSTSKQVVITVNKSNNSPVANAGNNITLNSRGQVTLNGSGSYDPDGDPLTYRWTVSNQVLSGIRPIYTAPYVEVTTNYTVTLIVNDGKTDSAPSEIVITVTPSNMKNATIIPDDTVLQSWRIGDETDDINNSEIIVYPNPTKGIVKIQYGYLVKNMVSITVFDLKGRIVKQEIHDKPVFNMIDLSDQIDGIYLLNIVTDNDQITEKVLLVK